MTKVKFFKLKAFQPLGNSPESDLKSITNFLTVPLRDAILFRRLSVDRIENRKRAAGGIDKGARGLNRTAAAGPTLVFDPVRYLNYFARHDLAPI